jgi:hypothetical protein
MSMVSKLTLEHLTHGAPHGYERRWRRIGKVSVEVDDNLPVGQSENETLLRHGCNLH